MPAGLIAKNCLDCGIGMVCYPTRKRCVPCVVAWRKIRVREISLSWNAANPHKRKIYSRSFWQTHKEKRTASYLAWLDENRGSKLGLGRGQYKVMLLAQSGLCAICGNPESAKRRQLLAVDHDHATGLVRELLCANCNSALGMVNDSLDILESMKRYLMKHSAITRVG